MTDGGKRDRQNMHVIGDDGKLYNNLPREIRDSLYRGAKLYNNLSREIRDEDNSRLFNRKIYKYLLNS